MSMDATSLQPRRAAPAIHPAPTVTPEPWSVLRAALLAPFLPARTSRHTQHMPLVLAWVIHFITGLAGAGSIFLYNYLVDPSELAWIARDFRRSPIEMSFLFGGIALLIELGFVALAGVILPWGARLEPLRWSFRHALRQTWLQTGTAALVVIITGYFIVAMLQAITAWQTSNPPPVYRSLMLPPTATAQEVARQQEADRRAWRDQLNAYRVRQPWYLRHDELLLLSVMSMLFAWYVFALVRAVGAERQGPPAELPRPRCEFCGYNLALARPDALCPECGQPVERSLGPDARPGAPWERRENLGRWAAYIATAREAALRPHRFGLKLRLVPEGTGHRGYLAIHLLPVFLICAACPILLLLTTSGSQPFWAELIGVAISLGVLSAAGLVVTSCAGAVLVSLFFWRERPLLLTTAMQAACYLSPLLTALTALCTLGIMIIETQRGWFVPFSGRGLTAGDLQVFASFSLAGVLVLFYLLTLLRIVRTTRYANR